ncbi:MAG: hypothetical protein WBA13_22395 [Microcoleaceae cyanobacterium]
MVTLLKRYEARKHDIARNLLSQLNNEAIAAATGLSLAVIEALRSEISNNQ